VIQFYHASKRYGNIHALNDVTFKVQDGEFSYITGPSGAGKSTALKLIYGAVPPSEGKVMVGGVNVGTLATRRIPFLRRNIGIIFQDFKLIPRRTIAENIGLALEVLGTPRDVIRRRVSAVLSIVGLPGRENEYPPTLSGGEQQRVAVARAIVNDPAIVLADEPTGNLDGAMAIEVMEVLQTINMRGATVIVATHDAALMERFPARILRFRAGRVKVGK
jgi:cell division transport system ATP-binding protein